MHSAIRWTWLRQVKLPITFGLYHLRLPHHDETLQTACALPSRSAALHHPALPCMATLELYSTLVHQRTVVGSGKGSRGTTNTVHPWPPMFAAFANGGLIYCRCFLRYLMQSHMNLWRISVQGDFRKS